MRKYRFITDPGHGWLEVPKSELKELGIAEQISTYSYESPDGSLAYLEEDCDAPRFNNARPFLGDWEIEEVYQENTFVRLLRRYSKEDQE